MIVRHTHNKDNPYFMLNRTACNDDTLSMKALGLHTYLLSKPDGWNVNSKQLMKRFDCGKDALRSAINELRDRGYWKKIEIRGEGGKIVDNEVHVYEYPILNEEENQISENQTISEPANIVINDSLENKETTRDSSSEFGEICTVYEGNIGLLTPMIGDKIKDAMDDYPTSWIVEGIEAAVAAEARHWNYVLGCLKNWKREGKSTVDKQEEKEANRKTYVSAGSDLE
jgi:DnaD/phage-associated family protein